MRVEKQMHHSRFLKNGKNVQQQKKDEWFTHELST